MTFIKYQHLERFGTEEVLNIEHGKIHVFPKIDGTNASVWIEGHLVCAGSRNRQLSLEKDNAGFYSWVLEQENIINLLKDYPDMRLYGEWLVPHSLKTYRDNAWKRFYVFDVCKLNEGEIEYLPYEEYQPVLDAYGIDYLPPIAVVNNCTYEKLIEYLNGNNFLIKDGEGCGEGIVIKNYGFENKYGRTIWAKIVTSEFRERHAKVMGNDTIEMNPPVEQLIVEEFLSSAVVDKVYDKIKTANEGWSSKFIPQLLNTVYYDLVREESWNFIKKFKNPTINYSMLQYISFRRVKELKSELF